MKLGFQTQELSPAVRDFAIRGNIGVFKSVMPQSVDLLWEVKTALPGCEFIYRYVFKPQPLDNPKRRAQEAVDAVMGHLEQSPYDLTELYNETGLWGEAYDYIVFTIEAARLLEARGQKLLAYSFAWGNPCGFVEDPYDDDPARWMEGLRQHWAPYCEGLRAVQAAGGGLALHQYKIPGEDDRFSILRHRMVRQVLPDDLKRIPIYLTEFGLDDKANPGDSGWSGSSWNWSPEQYATWLKETALTIGNEVAGATIFICGTPDWVSFDVLGYPVIADAIREANEQGGEPMVIDIVDELPRSGQPPTRPVEQIDKIVIHHVGLLDPVSPWATASYHTRPPEQDGRGWPCIGYHYFIEEDGTPYQTARHKEMTYHVGEHNPTSLGICLSGRFDSPNPPPTQAQKQVLSSLCSTLLDDLGLDNTAIKGHYELRPTACPGSGWFEEWRRGLAGPDLEQIIAELEAELADMRDDMEGIAQITGRWTS